MNLHDRFVVQRIYNNNVVLALDVRNRSVVLTGSGVGFGAVRGTVIDRSRIEALYVPEADSAVRAAQVLAGISPGVIAAAQRIVVEAGHELGASRTDALLLPIADHLAGAMERLRRGHGIDIPLVWEVKTLYPAELRMGERALDIARDMLGADLPAAESTAFALHFLTAGFSSGDVELTMRMTRSLDLIFHALEDELGHPLDRGSDSALRFITHLRYLFVRLADNLPTATMPAEVEASLAASIPDRMRVAERLARLLDVEWRAEVTKGEQAYIALHLHRLLDASDPR